MLFEILTNKGLSNNALKSGDRRATERQTESEHKDLLDITQFPEYPIIEAMPAGIEKEQALNALTAKAQLMEKGYPKYWDDEYPRRTISQSSSWVGNTTYDPYSKFMTVQLGKKSYGYPNKDPEEVAEFLNSPSLGKYLNER